MPWKPGKTVQWGRRRKKNQSDGDEASPVRNADNDDDAAESSPSRRKWKPGNTVSWGRRGRRGGDPSPPEDETGEEDGTPKPVVQTLQSKRSARFKATQRWRQTYNPKPKKNEQGIKKHVHFGDVVDDEDGSKDAIDEDEEERDTRRSSVLVRNRKPTPFVKKSRSAATEDDDDGGDSDDSLIIHSPKTTGFTEEMPETKVPPVEQSPKMLTRSFELAVGHTVGVHESILDTPKPKDDAVDLDRCLDTVRSALRDLRALRDELRAGLSS